MLALAKTGMRWPLVIGGVLFLGACATAEAGPIPLPITDATPSEATTQPLIEIETEPEGEVTESDIEEPEPQPEPEPELIGLAGTWVHPLALNIRLTIAEGEGEFSDPGLEARLAHIRSNPTYPDYIWGAPDLRYLKHIDDDGSLTIYAANPWFVNMVPDASGQTSLVGDWHIDQETIDQYFKVAKADQRSLAARLAMMAPEGNLLRFHEDGTGEEILQNLSVYTSKNAKDIPVLREMLGDKAYLLDDPDMVITAKAVLGEKVIHSFRWSPDGTISDWKVDEGSGRTIRFAVRSSGTREWWLPTPEFWHIGEDGTLGFYRIGSSTGQFSSPSDKYGSKASVAAEGLVRQRPIGSEILRPPAGATRVDEIEGFNIALSSVFITNGRDLELVNYWNSKATGAESSLPEPFLGLVIWPESEWNSDDITLELITPAGELLKPIVLGDTDHAWAAVFNLTDVSESPARSQIRVTTGGEYTLINP